MDHIVLNLKPFLNQYGYWVVFVAIFFEDFGLPTPGESLLIAGAVLASQGNMHIVPLLVTAWIAAVTGDNTGYLIGRYGGRRLVIRYGRNMFISEKRLETTERFFRRHGGGVVAVARFFEGLRQLNGIVAGIAHMPWWRFLSYNALGAALWVGFWGMLFYQLGTRADVVTYIFKRLNIFLIAVLVIVAAVIVLRWLMKRNEA